MVWQVLGSSKMAFALSVTPPIFLALSPAILPFWLPPFALVSSALIGINQRPVEVHLGALRMGFSMAFIVVVVAP